jgi:predicted Zn-ribbon and HTH transcriptional regulator
VPDFGPTGRTTRQRIVELLGREELGFEELREELQVTVKQLEDDLRHVERSVRRGGRRLQVLEPCCIECGFVFRGRAPRRFATPSRCPDCRSERLMPARMRIPAGGGRQPGR